MTLQNDRQLANTRRKLDRLEVRLQTLRAQTAGNPRVRELSMRSLQKLIKQFKEEIARYEVRRTTQARQ